MTAVSNRRARRRVQIASAALACGLCSAVAVLDEIRQGIPSHVSTDLAAQPLLSLTELRERMSGNLCRCGAYSNIVDAINEVAGKRT